MLKIGVLGAGHLGKIHLKLLKEIDAFELVGFYDPDAENANKVSSEFGLHVFENATQLIEAVDAVDIVTPTLSHHDCAVEAIAHNKHIFIEKPLCNSIELADDLLQKAEQSKVKIQVGHVERFNPAFLALEGRQLNPMFIETHRLAQFNPRGTDVSVVLDLMIHDLDIVLKIVNSEVKTINASGVPIISDSPDIANARLEFVNGCVANLTASRISMKQMRKTRIFQPDAYISMDFLEKKTEIFRLWNHPPGEGQPALEFETGNNGQKKYIGFEQPEAPEINSIKTELEMFAQSILKNEDPPVTIQDGYEALHLAYRILNKIEKGLSVRQ